eukprot:superscaffoldBa00004524_g19029
MTAVSEQSPPCFPHTAPSAHLWFSTDICRVVSTDKTRQAFRSNRPEFESFLDEMIGWFSDHQEQVDERFSPGDADRSGSVNLNDFQFGNPSPLCTSLNKLWEMSPPAFLLLALVDDCFIRLRSVVFSTPVENSRHLSSLL